MTTKRLTEQEEPAWLHQVLIIRTEDWEALQHAKQGYLIVRQDATRIEGKGIVSFYDISVDFSKKSVQLPKFYGVPLLGSAENGESNLQTKLQTRNLEERCERALVREQSEIALYDLVYGKTEFLKRPFLRDLSGRITLPHIPLTFITPILYVRMNEYLDGLLRSFPYAIWSVPHNNLPD